MDKHKTTAELLNRANEEFMERFSADFPDFARKREDMQKKFHNGYVQHNVSAYMNKSPEEQYEFSLMMADKMIGLDELYKTPDGKQYLDKFFKSRSIDLSKKPANMALSDFLEVELEQGHIKVDLTMVLLNASNGAHAEVKTTQAKKMAAFVSSNMEHKKLHPPPIYQTFVASKMRLKKIKETLSSIKCKNSARWALFFNQIIDSHQKHYVLICGILFLSLHSQELFYEFVLLAPYSFYIHHY